MIFLRFSRSMIIFITSHIIQARKHDRKVERVALTISLRGIKVFRSQIFLSPSTIGKAEWLALSLKVNYGLESYRRVLLNNFGVVSSLENVSSTLQVVEVPGGACILDFSIYRCGRLE